MYARAKGHLRLPHAPGVALASVLLSVFVGLALIALFFPGGLPEMM